MPAPCGPTWSRTPRCPRRPGCGPRCRTRAAGLGEAACSTPRKSRGPSIWACDKRTSTRYNWRCMLLELVVENYAVVERLRVHFHAGLNLLTGETGSGKSIVVDALGLLLGGRASADTIRTGQSRARVAGIFDVREGVLEHGAIRRLLEPAGLETEDGELLIEREIL